MASPLRPLRAEKCNLCLRNVLLPMSRNGHNHFRPPSTLFLFHSVPKDLADAPGFASLRFARLGKVREFSGIIAAKMNLLEDPHLDAMARRNFGYGRWDSKYWFIGPEQGMGKHKR